MTTVIPSGYILMTPTLEHEQYQPILIGMLLSFGFFGIGLTQFYRIWTQLRALWATGDRDWFHIVTLSVLLVADLADSFSKLFFMCIFSDKLITGGVGAVNIAPPSIISLLITAGFIASLTHLIYCRRFIKLQSKLRPPNEMWWVYLIMGITMVISLCTFAAACVTGYISITFPQSEWIPKMVPSACVELGGSALVDTFLCVIFIGSLRTQRSDFKNTNDIITRWTFFTLETNLLTSVLQILELILFLLFKSTAYHEAIILILPKVYINSILVLIGTVFANRIRYRDDGGLESSGGMPHAKGFSSSRFAQSNHGAIRSGLAGGIQVNIEKQFVNDDVELPDVPRRDSVSEKSKGFDRAFSNGYISN